MLRSLCLGLTLTSCLLAAPPTKTELWVLALDGKGALVGDLKASDLELKVGGKSVVITAVKTPDQTASLPQSWVLIFEPIRDTAFRALAFQAALDVLTKVPEGDRVLIVTRGKETFETLMPGFSEKRALWAEAMAKVPERLPEGLTGNSAPEIQGAGFDPAYRDAADGQAGQDVLNRLQATWKAAPSGWSKGSRDQRSVGVLDRLNFNQPGFVYSLVASVVKEGQALGHLMDRLAPISGLKHVVVFSRYDADDLVNPAVKKAATSTDFKRRSGDAGGPAESASYATREMSLLQEQVKNRANAAGLALYTVAGSGQNVTGFVGGVAQATGGYTYPLTAGIEFQLGQALQVFGSRHLVQWSEAAPAPSGAGLDLSSRRPGVRLIAPTQR